MSLLIVVVNCSLLVVCCLLYLLLVVCCGLPFCCLLVVDRWELACVSYMWIDVCRLSNSNVCCLRLCVDVSFFVVGCV